MNTDGEQTSSAIWAARPNITTGDANLMPLLDFMLYCNERERSQPCPSWKPFEAELDRLPKDTKNEVSYLNEYLKMARGEMQEIKARLEERLGWIADEEWIKEPREQHEWHATVLALHRVLARKDEVESATNNAILRLTKAEAELLVAEQIAAPETNVTLFERPRKNPNIPKDPTS